MYRKVS